MKKNAGGIKTAFFLFGLVLAACAMAVAQTQQETHQPSVENHDKSKSSDETSLYMQAKLTKSQKVLEGLVTEDFDLISDGAKQMKKIAEAAHWPTTIDEVYQHYNFAFRRQCDKLVVHADRGDLLAAHHTYLQMSTTCIDCHSYVRSKFKVERKRAGGPFRLIPTQWDGPTKMKRLPAPQPDDDDSIDS